MAINSRQARRNCAIYGLEPQGGLAFGGEVVYLGDGLRLSCSICIIFVLLEAVDSCSICIICVLFELRWHFELFFSICKPWQGLFHPVLGCTSKKESICF